MTEEIVPSMASLVSRFTQPERVYPDDPRLLRAYDQENRPCIIVADPTEPIHVARFDSPRRLAETIRFQQLPTLIGFEVQ